MSVVTIKSGKTYSQQWWYANLGDIIEPQSQRLVVQRGSWVVKAVGYVDFDGDVYLNPTLEYRTSGMGTEFLGIIVSDGKLNASAIVSGLDGKTYVKGPPLHLAIDGNLSCDMSGKQYMDVAAREPPLDCNDGVRFSRSKPCTCPMESYGGISHRPDCTDRARK